MVDRRSSFFSEFMTLAFPMLVRSRYARRYIKEQRGMSRKSCLRKRALLALVLDNSSNGSTASAAVGMPSPWYYVNYQQCSPYSIEMFFVTNLFNVRIRRYLKLLSVLLFQRTKNHLEYEGICVRIWVRRIVCDKYIIPKLTALHRVIALIPQNLGNLETLYISSLPQDQSKRQYLQRATIGLVSISGKPTTLIWAKNFMTQKVLYSMFRRVSAPHFQSGTNDWVAGW